MTASTASKILLINPPWATLQAPSIGLEQIAAVMREPQWSRYSVEVAYLNHDFGAWIGEELYSYVSMSMDSHNSGFGEWFFRGAAFPELADNWVQYKRRYRAHFPADRRPAIELLIERYRPLLNDWLDAWIGKHVLGDHALIGLSSMFQQNASAIALARLFKSRPNCPPIALGGANCEGVMGAAILHACPHFDYVFQGHALRSFPALMGVIASGELRAVTSLRGVLTRENCLDPARQSGTEKSTAVYEQAHERPVNEVVVPEYDVFMTSYAARFPNTVRKPELFFETSRGCWWGQVAHCTFCGLNGGAMEYRAMSPELAKEHLEEMFSRYGDRVDQYASVDNILPTEYIEKLFPALDVPPNAEMFYEVKADLAPKALKALARAHVTRLQPGIESLSTRTLKLMHKGTTAAGNVSFLDACEQLAITPYWNLLVGFPGEGADSYREYEASFGNLHHLPPPSGVFPIRFDRFSPYFVKAADFKLDLEPLDFYRYVYPYPAATLAQLAYYFQDRNYTADYVQTMTEWISTLTKLVEAWKTRYHGLDGLPKARLAAQRDASGLWTVIDSRSGATDEWNPDAAMSALIDRLQKPSPAVDLSPEQTALLDELRARRLVFEERGRCMSLARISPNAETDKPLEWTRRELTSASTQRNFVKKKAHQHALLATDKVD